MKLIAKLSVTALLVAFGAAPVLAQHGHHGGSGTSSQHPQSYQPPETQASTGERTETEAMKRITNRRVVSPPSLLSTVPSSAGRQEGAGKSKEPSEGYLKK